jgi:5'-phosphate synthase pdxT subunit
MSFILKAIRRNSLNDSQPAPHIGVLAIQGDYEAHARALEETGAIPSLVKTPEAL